MYHWVLRYVLFWRIRTKIYRKNSRTHKTEKTKKSDEKNTMSKLNKLIVKKDKSINKDLKKKNFKV